MNKNWWQTSTHGKSSLRVGRQKCAAAVAAEPLASGWTCRWGSNRKAHTPCWKLPAELGEGLQKTAPLIGLSTGTETTDTRTLTYRVTYTGFCQMSVFWVRSDKHTSDIPCLELMTPLVWLYQTKPICTISSNNHHYSRCWKKVIKIIFNHLKPVFDNIPDV